MDKIQVSVLDNAHSSPGGMMLFLAKLTQRGHKITNMDDLIYLYRQTVDTVQNRDVRPGLIEDIADLPHGTIKRFTPITIAIVGASRRFLAQARTHQVGMTYVSASLQYSNYAGHGDFVVPYEIMEYDANIPGSKRREYLNACEIAMENYKDFTNDGISNDTAGYMAPQGLRNILVIQGNHESWLNFIQRRSCLRNTVEMQYVTLLIWEALLTTPDGPEMFKYAGPYCRYGACREGHMACNRSTMQSLADPSYLIKELYPLLRR